MCTGCAQHRRCTTSTVNHAAPGRWPARGRRLPLAPRTARRTIITYLMRRCIGAGGGAPAASRVLHRVQLPCGVPPCMLAARWLTLVCVPPDPHRPIGVQAAGRSVRLPLHGAPPCAVAAPGRAGRTLSLCHTLSFVLAVVVFLLNPGECQNRPGVCTGLLCGVRLLGRRRGTHPVTPAAFCPCHMCDHRV